MGGSADPEAPSPSPSPSPAKPSPPLADGKQLRRCVQSKLSWGLVKPAGGGREGGGKGGGAGEAGRADADAVPPVPAAEEEAATKVREEPEKGKKKRKPRKSENGKKVHCPFQLLICVFSLNCAGGEYNFCSVEC